MRMADERRDADLEAIEAEENLLIDAQFMIQGVMNRKGLTRAEVARKAGLSKARLSQLMGPAANPTLKTIARVLHAMGERAALREHAVATLSAITRQQRPLRQWESAASKGVPHRLKLAPK